MPITNKLLTATATLALIWSAGAAASTARTDKMTVIEGVNNVEDLIAVSANWVFATSYSPAGKPTTLYLIDTRTKAAGQTDWHSVTAKPDTRDFPQCPGAPDFAALSTHGLDYYAERHLLYVVNHGGRESIEAFHVDLPAAGKPALTWVGCVLAPPHAYLDAVAGIKGTQLLATSLWDPDDQDKEKEMAEGTPLGTLLSWNQTQGWQVVPGSEPLSAPNGLVTTRDAKNIYVTAWAGKYVARLTASSDKSGKAGYKMTKAPVPYHPDNLRWSPDHSVLYSGGQAADLETLGKCLPSTEPSCPLVKLQLDAINPRTMATRVIIPAGTYDGVNAGTGAILVRGAYWLSSFKNTRIGVVPAR
jgi:hypothetical protein